MREWCKLHKAGHDTYWGRFCNLSRGGGGAFYFVIVMAVTSEYFRIVVKQTDSAVSRTQAWQVVQRDTELDSRLAFVTDPNVMQ